MAEGFGEHGEWYPSISLNHWIEGSLKHVDVLALDLDGREEPEYVLGDANSLPLGDAMPGDMLQAFETPDGGMKIVNLRHVVTATPLVLWTALEDVSGWPTAKSTVRERRAYRNPGETLRLVDEMHRLGLGKDPR